MGKKYDAPPAPDYDKLIKQTEVQIAANEKMLDKYLKFGREALQADRKVVDQILDVQLPAMKDEAAAAKRARQRYEQEGVPFEREYLQKLQGWDTPQRREQRAGEVGADMRTSFDAAQQNEERRLSGYGLDPSQVRSTSHMGALEALNSAQMAGAQNRARRGVEQEGLALGGEALNIQRGLPAQTAQAYATAAGAGGLAGGTSAQHTGQNIDFYRGTQDFMRTNLSGLQGSYSVANAIYGNQLQAARDEAAAKSAPFSALGNIAGMALGGWAGGGFGFQEGGPVKPSMSPSRGMMPDDVPAALTAGEYVIPQDVVRWLGEEKLSKMVDKAREGYSALKGVGYA